MNLLLDSWIPVTRADGAADWIAPWQLTDELAINPPAALAYNRPDFTGSIAQFLIGLLQTVVPDCQDEEDWDDLDHSPPTTDTLRGWLTPWASAFELTGDGARFMQDTALEVQSATALNIASLLIDAPGGNTLKHNVDHFVKRGGVNQLSPPLAAAALYTLQTMAPSGGQGHRTSIRGGGPLTTLIMCDPRSVDRSQTNRSTLWHNTWLNVLPWESFTLRYPGPRPTTPNAEVFPWLAPTRTSNPKANGSNTTPMDAHPLQMYWAMPRRLLLDAEHTQPGPCDLSEIKHQQCFIGYRTINFGVNYEGPWQHPLSPYYFDKPGAAPLPVHMSPGGLQYRHWAGLINTHGTQGTERKVAQVVTHHLDRIRHQQSEQFCLWAFGYDMDNMKARGWYDSKLPLYGLPPGAARKIFEITIEQLVEAARLVRLYLSAAVKQAWFKRPGDAKGDMSAIDIQFWRTSEAPFYSAVEALNNKLQDGNEPTDIPRMTCIDWHHTLRRIALEHFDHWTSRSDFVREDPARMVSAQVSLRRKLRGKSLLNALDLSKEQLNEPHRSTDDVP